MSTPTPAGGQLQLLGSCEELGAVEQLEELSRLDRKIKHLEKAETAAVEKIKLLTAENEELKASLEEVKCSLANSEDRLEGVKAELAVYVDKVSECSALEAELRSSVRILEVEKLRLEEVESERDVLLERLTQQQVLTKTRDPVGSKNTYIGSRFRYPASSRPCSQAGTSWGREPGRPRLWPS